MTLTIDDLKQIRRAVVQTGAWEGLGEFKLRTGVLNAVVISLFLRDYGEVWHPGRDPRPSCNVTKEVVRIASVILGAHVKDRDEYGWPEGWPADKIREMLVELERHAVA